MRWWNRYNFPYSNFHDLNLDWIIKEMNRVIEEWETLKAEWEQMKLDWAEFQAEMQRLWQEYKDLMNAAWEAFQNAMRDEWEQYKDDLNQEWDQYKDDMDAAWAAYQADLNAQWTTYQNNLNASWLAYQNAVNGRLDAQDDEIDAFKDEVNTIVAQLNSDWLAFKTYVENYLANLDIATVITPIVNQWLDDHGVSIKVKTPEDFGAIGDGTTDDTTAWNNFMLDNSSIHMLMPGKTYKIGDYQTRANISGKLYGNGAKVIGSINFAAGANVEDLVLDELYIHGVSQQSDKIVLRNITTKTVDIQNNTLASIEIDGLSFVDTASFAGLAYITIANTPNVVIKNLNNFDPPTGVYLCSVFNSLNVYIYPNRRTNERFIEATANGGSASTKYTTVYAFGDIRQVGYPVSWNGAIDADIGSTVFINYNNTTSVSDNI